MIASPPLSSASEPPPRLCANAAAMSMPFGVVEAAARSRRSRRRSRRARRRTSRRTTPTLPKPCTATRSALRARGPASRSADSRQKIAPRAVASSRPSEPPIVSGLPVTTPSTECPLFIEYVSKIQAIDRRVRADVGRRDVLLRSDLVDDLGREAARHALELAERHRLRIADDAALRAAERQPHQRALPGHPHRERLHLVERDVRVVADAALRRAARDVVRDAVAGERAHRAVVHRRRDRDLDRLLALLQHVDEALVDAERLGDLWSCCCASGNGFSRRCDSGAAVAIDARGYSIVNETCALLGSRPRQRGPGGEPQLVRAGRRAGRSSARGP